jgi:hypothetical protein
MQGMKFSIRDLLWLTAVVALGAAWWFDRSGLTVQNRSLKDQLSEVRMAELRARELNGGVILTPDPEGSVR